MEHRLASSSSAAATPVHSLRITFSCFKPSPTRPLSLSRTRGCLRKYRYNDATPWKHLNIRLQPALFWTLSVGRLPMHNQYSTRSSRVLLDCAGPYSAWCGGTTASCFTTSRVTISRQRSIFAFCRRIQKGQTVRWQQGGQYWTPPSLK